MKKILILLFVLVLALMIATPVFAQGTEPPATPPPIPTEFTAALTGLLAFVVTQGLKSLSAFLAKYPWLAWIDISGWGSVIVAFLVTGLLFYINLGLSFVPTAYTSLVPLIFQFLIGLFTAYGSHLTMKSIAVNR